MTETHIVTEFMIGNTTIKIADDCCCQKTPEDVKQMLTQIAKRMQRYFSEPVREVGPMSVQKK